MAFLHYASSQPSSILQNSLLYFVTDPTSLPDRSCLPAHIVHRVHHGFHTGANHSTFQSRQRIRMNVNLLLLLCRLVALWPLAQPNRAPPRGAQCSRGLKSPTTASVSHPGRTRYAQICSVEGCVGVHVCVLEHSAVTPHPLMQEGPRVHARNAIKLGWSSHNLVYECVAILRIDCFPQLNSLLQLC